MAADVKHDRDEKRFFVDLGDGSEAELVYEERSGDVLDYTHTFVPEAHRGQGIAEDLVLHALDHAREEGRKIIPSCPYVRHVIEDEHTEYRSLVASDGDEPED